MFQFRRLTAVVLQGVFLLQLMLSAGSVCDCSGNAVHASHRQVGALPGASMAAQAVPATAGSGGAVSGAGAVRGIASNTHIPDATVPGQAGHHHAHPGLTESATSATHTRMALASGNAADGGDRTSRAPDAQCTHTGGQPCSMPAGGASCSSMTMCGMSLFAVTTDAAFPSVTAAAFTMRAYGEIPPGRVRTPEPPPPRG